MNTTATRNNQPATPTPEQPRVPQGYVSPDVNIYETPEGYILEAELPGVSREGLDINVEGGTLTLVGRRTVSDLAAEAVWRESSAADYRRVFELDPAIDTTK